MTTTKLAVVCGVVLLATGLTFGVGWVAAGTGSSGSAPGAAVIQAGQTPAPPKKDADSKDTKATERWTKLMQQAEAIALRIDKVQARMAQEVDEPNIVDVSVLQSELFSVDKDILTAESQLKVERRTFERAVREAETAMKQPLEEPEVVALLQREPRVREAETRLLKAVEAVASLKLKLGADHPVSQAAVKEVADAETTIKAAREKARPVAEQQLRDRMKKSITDFVTRAKDQIEVADNRLEELLMTRKKLAERIADARRGEGRRQVLQDELRVLRDIQVELLRQRTLAELGLEGLPAAPARPEPDPKVEMQIKELRREIEVLRAEVERLRKKN